MMPGADEMIGDTFSTAGYVHEDMLFHQESNHQPGEALFRIKKFFYTRIMISGDILISTIERIARSKCGISRNSCHEVPGNTMFHVPDYKKIGPVSFINSTSLSMRSSALLEYIP